MTPLWPRVCRTMFAKDRIRVSGRPLGVRPDLCAVWVESVGMPRYQCWDLQVVEDGEGSEGRREKRREEDEQ